jgi:hypothetical protein
MQIRSSLRNLLVHAASEVWDSDGRGSILPDSYTVPSGPDEGNRVVTSDHYLATWLKAIGVADPTKDINAGLEELDINPLVPYTRSPKLIPENEDEIVMQLEVLRLLKKLSNADFAKQAVAKAAVLEKEQVADADDTGDAKGKLFCLYNI